MTEDNKKELMTAITAKISDAIDALVDIDGATDVTSTNKLIAVDGDTYEVVTKIKRTPTPKEPEA